MRSLLLIAVAALIVGCGDKYDENYSTDVKLSPARLHRKARKGRKGAEGDGRTDLRRQAMRRSSEHLGASREEAPEESIFL
jgi:hypothetical protein